MNKILLDNELIANLNIEEDSILYINNNDTLNINITINDNKKLIIHEYNERSKKYNIKIKQYNNTEFVYNHSYLSKDNYELNIDIKLCGNCSKNKINIHGVNDGGNSNIYVNGNVLKDTEDNELYENIKIMNINGGKVEIRPNMFIDTKNVIANHSASVTNIDKDYLFYLNSKGIDNKDGAKLIIDGFLNKKNLIEGGE